MNQAQALRLLLPGGNLRAVKAGWNGKNQIYQGIFHNYWVILEPGTGTEGHAAGTFRVTVNASLADGSELRDLDRLLLQLAEQEKKHVIAAHRAGHAVVLELRAALNKKSIEEVINPLTTQVVYFLETHHIPTGCQSCGNVNAPLESYTVNNDSHFFCHDCAVKTEQELKANQTEIRKKNSNVLLGIVGAFLGGLIGVALWIGIDQLGYIAAISGLVMAVAACKGYELLGKALDRKGVIVCAVIVLVLAYFATKLCWTIALYQAPGDHWDFGYCYRMLEAVLEYNDKMGSYIADMVMGYVFTILGAGGVLYSSFKNASGSYAFRKNM